MGWSVGKPPSTGSMPKAKSLSKSGSKEERPSGSRRRFQSKASRWPKIKNYPVAFGDGAVVQCFGADNLEEFFASAARSLEARNELIDAGRWRDCCRIHEVPPKYEFATQRLGQTGLNDARRLQALV